MNILLIGSGGREHALALKMSESQLCDTLFVTPGNPGTDEIGNNIVLDVNDHDHVIHFISANSINMVVIGPEAPLVAGLVDAIKKADSTVVVVGPSAEGAQLEGSKAYAKAFMQRHGVPTAGYFECDASNVLEGKEYLAQMNSPYVLKADGLAAGKGVLIINDLKEAQFELEQMLEGKFGNASSKVVIEEFLDGIEFSVFALTDGNDFILLPEAKDYKRIGEGDTGLNTGGMGAISPVPFVDDALMNKVIEKVVKPTINGLQSESIIYKGFVFFGIIKVGDEPKVIEYNCRMGDPETEVVLPRFTSDLVEAFMAMENGTLSTFNTEIDPWSAATVMVVSGGYPEGYQKGKEITNLPIDEEGILFHAGTKMENGKLKTNGGRVIALTSFGSDHKEAVRKSLIKAESISYEGKYYRKDIGFDL